MKQLIMLLLLLPGVMQLHAQSEHNKRRGLKWDTTRVNLGDIIISHTPVKKDVYFTNTSDSLLIIHSCHTSDGGSMIAEFPREPILPGKRAKVVFLKDVSRPGTFNKAISTTTNQGLEQVVMVSGNVVYPKPNYKIITSGEGITNPVQYGHTDSFVIIVRNQDSSPFTAYFMSEAYPEMDLLSYRGLGSKDWNGSANPVKEIRFSISFINNYGNTGRVKRYMPFSVNNQDTVYVPLNITYTGAPPDSVVIQSYGQGGYTTLHYTRKQLSLKEVFDAKAELMSRYWFKEGTILKGEKRKFNGYMPTNQMEPIKYKEGRLKE